MVTRTELHIDKFSNKIGYSKPVFLIGSCFSDNIGSMLEKARIPSLCNPFGTVYNPSSILTQLEYLIGKADVRKERIIYRDNNYYHLDFHSSFLGKNKSSLIEKLEESKQKATALLAESSHVFITLGTAWVYELKEDEKTVANCHKLPGNLFTKKLLSIEMIFADIQKTVQHIKEMNPQCDVFFTVSPVRHIKDGIIENTRSKARLSEAVHMIVDSESAGYFPAYEWMIDDLRDYRYYEDDMIHPSKLAVQYIWEQFSDAYFTHETKKMIEFANKIFLLRQHKTFESSGSNYDNHIEKINTLEREWKIKLDQIR